MCGRFTLRQNPRTVFRAVGLPDVEDALPPRYNVAPSQDIAVLRVQGDRVEPVMLRWGLIPAWAKDPAIGYRMINARAETVMEKPSFRTPFRQRRCAVLADGFYEWQKLGSRKQPWLIGLADGRPFAFAGLWDAWRTPDGGRLETCTILTTAANTLVAPIHDRMPVILPDEALADWLMTPPMAAEGLTALLRPYPADAMAARPVSPRVNSPQNDDAACAEALPA